MRTERDWDDLYAQFWATVAEYEKLRARLADMENRLHEHKKEDLDKYASGCIEGNVCEGRLQMADDLLSVLASPDTAHVAQLRARLATAEAVIAALPKCDSCEDKATYSSVLDSGMLSRMCDKHVLWGSWKVTYAAPLRAYLALGKEGGK